MPYCEVSVVRFVSVEHGNSKSDVVPHGGRGDVVELLHASRSSTLTTDGRVRMRGFNQSLRNVVDETLGLGGGSLELDIGEATRRCKLAYGDNENQWDMITHEIVG